jgi:hypothetical protein
MSRGYLSIPNQPIIYRPEAELSVDCSCTNGGYSQLVDFDDEIFMQFKALPCGRPLYGGEEPIFSNDVIYNGFTVDKYNISNSWGILWSFAAFMQYDVIKITVTVSDIQQGTLPIIDGYSVYNITAVGVYEIYFPNYYFNTGTYLIGAGGNPNNFRGSFTITAVEGIPIGGLFIGLVDATTLETIETIYPTITRTDNIMTVGFNVSELTIEAGCYRLGIADYCTNTCGQYFIPNPFFNCDRGGVPFWTDITTDEFASVTIDCNLVTLCSSNEESGMAILQSAIDVCEGVTYSYTIEVEYQFGEGNGDLIFRVNDFPCIYSSSPITGTGTLTGTFTPTCSGTLTIAFVSTLGPACVEISYVQIRATQETATYDHFSDVLNIGDFDNECEFFKIEGCNAEDQLGMYFNNTSFLPGIRLAGRRFHPQYDVDLDIFRYASGRYQTTYADRKKRWRFNFGRLPEYVLDFLSVVFYFDKTYVNGVIYVPASDKFPEVQYDDADDYGALDIDLYKQDDKIRKTVCAASDASCLPSILSNVDEPFLLTQSSERIITEGGNNIYYQN